MSVPAPPRVHSVTHHEEVLPHRRVVTLPDHESLEARVAPHAGLPLSGFQPFLYSCANLLRESLSWHVGRREVLHELVGDVHAVELVHG